MLLGSASVSNGNRDDLTEKKVVSERELKNVAFDGLPDGLIENLLLPENIDQLTDILTYHLVAGDALLSSSLSNGNIEMLNGDTASIDLSNGAMINDANIIFPDILASNGIVHVIDNVSKTQFTTYISGIVLPHFNWFHFY